MSDPILESMVKQQSISLIVIAWVVMLTASVVSGQQAAQVSPAIGPELGEMAPDFELPALDGKSLRLSSVRGRIVLLEFTATWCPACNQAASDLRKLKRRFGRALSVISVSLDGGENTDTTREDLLRFVKQERVDWPVLFDDTGTDNSAARAYGVERLPAYVLIDGAGIVRLIKHGAGVSGVMEKELRRLIANHPRS